MSEASEGAWILYCWADDLRFTQQGKIKSERDGSLRRAPSSCRGTFGRCVHEEGATGIAALRVSL
jgi:hypothetical protein